MSPSLRQRNRIRAMRELQEIALDRFEREGFDTVTVDQVAADAGVSPSTVYRYFGTKEGIVVWDEVDRDIDAQLVARLGKQPPIEAFRDSLIATFSDDEANQALLRRVRFMYATPQIHAAAIEAELEDQEELATSFALVGGRKRPSVADDVLAATCMAALGVAINHWQESEGKSKLSQLIAEAFAALPGGRDE